MRRMMIPVMALAITLLPAALAAQTPGQRGPRGPMGPPVERLIEQREELGLSAQQVTELRRIQTQLQEKNRPLLAQMEAARESITPEQRQQMRERMRQTMQERRGQMRERMQGARGAPGARMPEQLQPVLQQLRENTRDAARQVHAVLTAEQRQKLMELRPNRRAPGAAR